MKNNKIIILQTLALILENIVLIFGIIYLCKKEKLYAKKPNAPEEKNIDFEW